MNLLGRKKQKAGLPPDMDYIQFTREQELQPHLILGLTGAGKTHLIRQYIWSLQKQNRPLVIFDPERQLIQEFGKPEDYIINVDDERCIYWDLASEFKGIGVARSVARCLLSRGDAKEPGRNDIWYEWATDLFAAVLDVERRAGTLTTRRLYQLLAYPDSFKKVLQGTPQANILPEKAPEQRAGVEGMLMRLATPLRMMPEEVTRSHRSFSVRNYLDHPKGNIWITTLAETREASQPLSTSFMSLVLRGIMSRETMKAYGGVICDELQLMDHVGPLKEATTNMRKRGWLLLFGTQTMTQGKLIYRDEWSVMADNAGTRFWFKTQGEDMDLAEKSIGKQTFVQGQVTETDSGKFMEGPKRSRSIRLHEEPLVKLSEIEGQANMQCWLSQGGFRRHASDPGKMIGIPLEIPYRQWPKRFDAIQRRDMPELTIPPPPEIDMLKEEQQAAAAKKAEEQKKQTEEQAKQLASVLQGKGVPSGPSTKHPSIAEQEDPPPDQDKEQAGYQDLVAARRSQSKEPVEKKEKAYKHLTAAQKHNASVFAKVAMGKVNATAVEEDEEDEDEE